MGHAVDVGRGGFRVDPADQFPALVARLQRVAAELAVVLGRLRQDLRDRALAHAVDVNDHIRAEASAVSGLSVGALDPGPRVLTLFLR